MNPEAGARAPRRFFLAAAPGAGGPALLPEDEVHAARVLRLGPGDELLGLDGRGGVHPLRVRARERASLRLEAAGPPWREPEPGAPGAPLPWIEVAFAPPKGGRADELVDRLVQLGAAALAPLVARRTQRGERALQPARLARWERTAREACKQCGRAWLPELREPAPLAELLERARGGALALLDPAAPRRLVDWAAEVAPGPCGTRARPLVLLVGPEGGFDGEERALALAAGAQPLCLGPHVLRIETAAQAALAGLAQVLYRPAAQNPMRSRSET